MYITEPTTCYIFRQKWNEILHELATLSYIPGYTWVPCPPWLGVSWWNCPSRIHYSLFRNLCSLNCQFPYNFWKWFFFFFFNDSYCIQMLPSPSTLPGLPELSSSLSWIPIILSYLPYPLHDSALHFRCTSYFFHQTTNSLANTWWGMSCVSINAKKCLIPLYIIYPACLLPIRS